MVPPEPVQIGDVSIGPGRPLVLIAGPCVIESAERCLKLAEFAAHLCRRLGIGYIFKASFDKANRTDVHSFRGPGLHDGLDILRRVRDAVGVPVLSDIHEPSQAAAAGEVLDVIQIPAFLCRQTDLILAAARTGKPVNIKKGQFMAPARMKEAVDKVHSTGHRRVLLTERGTFFGYGALVNDMTAIEYMRRLAPVVFDATHSCQTPGHSESAAPATGAPATGPQSPRAHPTRPQQPDPPVAQTGGRRELAPLLARAAVAAGADALFLEIHDDPDAAQSDKATVQPLEAVEPLLVPCLRIREIVERGGGR